MTSWIDYLTRAGMRHRIRHLKHQLAAAEHDREQLTTKLSLTGRELAQVSHDHKALQKRCQELETARQAVEGQLTALQSKLMRGWYEQTRDRRVDVPAPADDPQSAFYRAERSSSDTQETPVVSLSAALLTQPTDGGEAPCPPSP